MLRSVFRCYSWGVGFSIVGSLGFERFRVEGVEGVWGFRGFGGFGVERV